MDNETPSAAENVQERADLTQTEATFDKYSFQTDKKEAPVEIAVESVKPAQAEPLRIVSERTTKLPPNPDRRLSVVGDLPTFTNEVIIIRPK